jgi:hypothetical protein
MRPDERVAVVMGFNVHAGAGGRWPTDEIASGWNEFASI